MVATRYGLTLDEFLAQPAQDVALEFADAEATQEMSPEQSVDRLIRRCLLFAATSVPLTRLLDPMDESVLEFRADEPPRALVGDDAIDLGHLRAGGSVRVADNFTVPQMD